MPTRNHYCCIYYVPFPRINSLTFCSCRGICASIAISAMCMDTTQWFSIISQELFCMFCYQLQHIHSQWCLLVHILSQPPYWFFGLNIYVLPYVLLTHTLGKQTKKTSTNHEATCLSWSTCLWNVTNEVYIVLSHQHTPLSPHANLDNFWWYTTDVLIKSKNLNSMQDTIPWIKYLNDLYNL